MLSSSSLSIHLLLIWSLLRCTTSITNAANDREGPAYCKGRYAICASSTCTSTGGTIVSKVAGGGTATYPEALCICPIIHSTFQALGANLGQMTGSCTQPGKGQVWSMFTPEPRPQAMFNYSKKRPDTLVLEQLCGYPIITNPTTFANCFGFPCTVQPPLKVQGGVVHLANCRCPIGSDQDGNPVPPGSPFQHQAGQCNSDYCSQLPVGIPYAGSEENPAWSCLGIPPPLPTSR